MVKPRKGKRPFHKGNSDESEAQNPFENEEFCLSPLSFFSAEVPCLSVSSKDEVRLTNAHRLPDLAQTLGETSFADLSLGWSRQGLHISVRVNKPFEESRFSEVQEGDSVELFVDTRNVKTSGFNTRFCHHFFFLPQPTSDRQAGELTHFRAEETHEWCNPADLKVQSFFGKTSYTLNLFIPAHCLHGYDPDQFDHLGFTYRINRCGGSSQHFSVSSEDYQIEEQPSLWSSLRLVTGKEP